MKVNSWPTRNSHTQAASAITTTSAQTRRARPDIGVRAALGAGLYGGGGGCPYQPFGGVGSPAVGNLIRENNTHQIPGVLQTHSKDGMCTLDQSLAERYAEGLISRNEAIERAQDLKELMKLIQTTDQKKGISG